MTSKIKNIISRYSMRNSFSNWFLSVGNSGKSAGFTIIEVMIAMAIFIVILTVGMGATLDAISQHYRTQNMRTVMDSMNFMIEDMARNIRLGTNVHCVIGSEVITDPLGKIIPQDCPQVPGVSGGSNMIVFNDLRGNQLTYAISRPDSVMPIIPLQVYKQKDASSTAQIITPPGVVMDYYKSGFTVRGSKPASLGDKGQPSVVIRLAGYVLYKNVKTDFAVQTTVMLRALDS